MPAGVTFAVVGHNEVDRLALALGQAQAAAGPDDVVWFVDSASTDGSADRAAALGAEVVPAPLGKGRAVATALDRCSSEYLVLIDGDMEGSSQNIAAALRDATRAIEADMIIGSFVEPARRRALTPFLYRPLMRALFPECPSNEVEIPLSGMRALRTGVDLGLLPPGYGVESHLNIEYTLGGGVVAAIDLGEYVGPLRGYHNTAPVAEAVADAILDCAVAHGRIGVEGRAPWQEWTRGVIDALATVPAPGSDGHAFLALVADASAHPLPAKSAVPG